MKAHLGTLEAIDGFEAGVSGNSDRLHAVHLKIRSVDPSIIRGIVKPSIVLLRVMVMKQNHEERAIVLTNCVPLGARMMPLAAAAGNRAGEEGAFSRQS